MFDNTETIWYGTSDLAKLSTSLQKRIFPNGGEALTTHGEILRQLGFIYYDRNNNGFGNGPFKIAFDYVARHVDKLIPFISEKAFKDFSWDFECAGYGADQVEHHWEGDAGLELLVGAAVKFADQCEKESPSPYRNLSDLVADLSSDDCTRVLTAAPFARKVILRDDISKELREPLTIAILDALERALAV
jgi:hypothetical protein